VVATFVSHPETQQTADFLRGTSASPDHV